MPWSKILSFRQKISRPSCSSSPRRTWIFIVPTYSRRICVCPSKRGLTKSQTPSPNDRLDPVMQDTCISKAAQENQTTLHSHHCCCEVQALQHPLRGIKIKSNSLSVLSLVSAIRTYGGYDRALLLCASFFSTWSVTPHTFKPHFFAVLLAKDHSLLQTNSLFTS